MTRKVVSFIFVFFFGLGFIFTAQKHAVAFDCLTLTSSSSDRNKEYCKSELADIEAELARLVDLQKKQQKQTGTLTGDVNYLTSQINALKAKIQARAMVIAQLKVAITEKVHTINSLEKKIAREHESIAQLLRNTNEFDNENMVHL